MSGEAVTDIQEWLEHAVLEKYADAFSEHEITLEVPADLTEPHIDRLASNREPRRRLTVAIHGS
jgi:hypothetical protein